MKISDTIKIHDRTNKGFEAWGDGLAEYGKLRKAFLHSFGFEAVFATLDPEYYCFLEDFTPTLSKPQHETLISALKSNNVEVILASDLAQKVPMEVLLEQIEFQGVQESEKEKFLKRYLSIASPIELILTRPIISRKQGETRFTNQLSFSTSTPAASYYFSRDSVFQTGPGAHVLSSMAYTVRKQEPEVTKLLFSYLDDTDIIYQVKSPDTIEGGEVIPIGDTILLGVGTERTTYGAVEQLMKNNAVGHTFVGLVEIPSEKLAVIIKEQNRERLRQIKKVDASGNPVYEPIDFMHLDTFFNVFSENKAIIFEDLFENEMVTIRLFKRTEDEYKLYEKPKPFKEYLEKDRGMDVGKITKVDIAEQLNMATNGLTLAPEKFLALKRSDEPSSFTDRIREMGVKVIELDLGEITKGQGGAHCMTQPIERELV